MAPLAIAATASLAQTAPPQAAEQVSTVVVTGSRILRESTDTPAPLQIITSEDIANSGYTSTAALFQALTTNGEANLNQGFGGAFAAGASGIALRGMTVDATLVLIDGHRMANYPIGVIVNAWFSNIWRWSGKKMRRKNHWTTAGQSSTSTPCTNAKTSPHPSRRSATTARRRARAGTGARCVRLRAGCDDVFLAQVDECRDDAWSGGGWAGMKRAATEIAACPRKRAGPFTLC